MLDGLSSPVKHIIDLIMAFFAAVGMAFATLIPIVASSLAAIWYVTRLMDWWRERKERKNANVKLD
jgi:hypothetical protein